jgi:hypothetical protein
MDAVVPATHAAAQLDPHPVASDHSGKTTRAYRANALPALFVIDKRGVVRDVLVGYSADRLAELERLVQSLTSERSTRLRGGKLRLRVSPSDNRASALLVLAATAAHAQVDARMLGRRGAGSRASARCSWSVQRRPAPPGLVSL